MDSSFSLESGESVLVSGTSPVCENFEQFMEGVLLNPSEQAQWTCYDWPEVNVGVVNGGVDVDVQQVRIRLLLVKYGIHAHMLNGIAIDSDSPFHGYVVNGDRTNVLSRPVDPVWVVGRPLRPGNTGYQHLQQILRDDLGFDEGAVPNGGLPLKWDLKRWKGMAVRLRAGKVNT